MTQNTDTDQDAIEAQIIKLFMQLSPTAKHDLIDQLIALEAEEDESSVDD